MSCKRSIPRHATSCTCTNQREPCNHKMKIGDLSRTTGLSVAHLRRLALAGEIPGAVKCPGRHLRFRKCPRLTSWMQQARTKRAGRQAKKESEGKLSAIRAQLLQFRPSKSASPEEARFVQQTLRFIRAYHARPAHARLPKYHAELRKILAPVLGDLSQPEAAPSPTRPPSPRS